ncbi:MAG TPA: hypothetical protein VIH57_19635, partial [Bacteroidales bacterium]
MTKNVMKLQYFILLMLIVFAGKLLAQTPLSCDEIAYAYPINSITIDGDISDWPKDIARYSIDNVYGNKLKNREDFNAYFQVAYNLSEQSLYFAIVVSDDSHIIDTTQNADWDTQDTYSLYLDSKHLLTGSGVVAYQFNEKWKKLLNPADSWDPEVKNANWDNVQVASKHQGSKTIYECRLVLKKQLFPGRSIGVDHVIIDKDADNGKGVRSYISWGRNQGKDNSPGKLGYVILMKADESTGTIAGQIKWKNDSIKGFPGNIRITSANNPALWVQTTVDSTGRYSVMLPAGRYTVSPVWSFWGMNDNLYKIDRKRSS